MSDITTRAGKGEPLTHNEVDENFTNLNSEKYQAGDNPSFGSITVTGTVDGRDVAADGSKLDGIEANADVTDSLNVTAAGALMDSEVTNLAQVKAFDSADYATAAQGSLADTALQPADVGTAAVEDSTAFAAAAHTHTLSDVTDAGTAATLDAPATGDAAAGEVVKGDDSRLSDARTPTAHTHTKADITDFNEADYATGAEGDLAATAVQPGDDADTLGSGAATDGQVLTADGAGGAAWEDGGGGGGLVFITSSDLSNDATADFTAFDATKYDAYKFVLQNVVPATNSVNLYMRTSTDGGTTFDSGASDYKESDEEIRSAFTLSTSERVGNAGGGCSGFLEVYGPHLASKTMFTSLLPYENSGGEVRAAAGYGFRDSAADVDAVRFYFSSGNIASGTITMYGMVNA